jgi:hypothetical protein
LRNLIGLALKHTRYLKVAFSRKCDSFIKSPK